jgi:hypothetical protein
MADEKYISKVTVGSQEYLVKDSWARNAIEGLGSPTHFIGETTTAISDGDTEHGTITINGQSVTAAAGDIVVYSNAEFIYSGTAWIELGDLSGLGDLAYKDTASATYTPAGTVSQPTFSGSSLTSTGTFTPEGSVSLTTEATTVVDDVDVTTGTVKEMATAGSVTAGSAASLASGFYTEGTAASASFSEGAFTPNTPTAVDTSKFNAGALPSKAADTWSAGSLPSKAADTFSAGTQASWSASVDDSTETLSFSFTANTLPSFTEGAFDAGSLPSYTEGSFDAGSLPSLGSGFVTPGTAAQKAADSFSFTANTPGSLDTSKFNGGTPTAVTLPTFQDASVVTDVAVSTDGSIDIPTSASFSGTQGNISVSGTPAGTVSQPTFEGSAATITVS